MKHFVNVYVSAVQSHFWRIWKIVTENLLVWMRLFGVLGVTWNFVNEKSFFYL